MANLSYIRNFCFSHSSKDELSYCLSTFEAAVEYINLGKLQNTHSVRNTLRDRLCILPSHCSFPAVFNGTDGRSVFPPSQGSGELNDKALFKEKMNLLAQSTATPIHCLFEVSCTKLDHRSAEHSGCYVPESISHFDEFTKQPDVQK